jgi:septal ring factor EnvC (AmiA/AmiB activator)
MLKRIVILAVLISSPALAQNAPPDPVAATYAQLLTEANGRVAALSAQVQQINQTKATLETRIGDLEKQIEALKPKPAIPPPMAAGAPSANPDAK